MVMGCTRRKKRGKRSAPPASGHLPTAVGRQVEPRTMEVWYAPSVKDVYAQLMIAKTMLDRIPDQELAPVKREMGLLEDMVWQFCR